MDAVIIAIGSEMLTPQKVDTNSLYLTDQLNSRGVEVVAKMVVGDDRRRLVAAMRDSLAQADLLLLSGGLGPTEDDVTRDAVAELVGRKLIYRLDAEEQIIARFRQINRPMAEINKRQAFVIDGAEILPNERGTAPGQWLSWNGKHIVLLPGPPRELKGLWESQCVARLDAILPVQVIRTRHYRVAGMGESDLDQLIAPLYRDYVNPATTILAALGDIQIHLRARCETAREADALLAKVGDPIAEALGDRIYSRDGSPLEATVGSMLRDRALTIAVAESVTGGMLAERLTSVPGSSDYFVGGFLTYSYAAKTRLLGIDPDLLQEHRAVSEPVAEAMARSCVELTGASIGVAITGLAGPSQGNEREPVGTVYIALCSGESCHVRRTQMAGERNRIRTLATQTALDLVRRHMLKHATQ